jgi:hypothetical protein
MAKFGQPILFFLCCPCGDFHEKTQPHYRAQKRRAAKRRQAKEAAQAEQQTQQQH